MSLDGTDATVYPSNLRKKELYGNLDSDIGVCIIRERAMEMTSLMDAHCGETV